MNDIDDSNDDDDDFANDSMTMMLTLVNDDAVDDIDDKVCYWQHNPCRAQHNLRLCQPR